MCGQPLMVIKFYYQVSSYNALYHHKNKLNHNAYVSNIFVKCTEFKRMKLYFFE